MALTLQDGRLVTITDGMLGLGAGLDADSLVVSTIPTIGNIYKDGVLLAVSDSLTLGEVRAGSLTFLASSGILGDTTFGFNSDATLIDVTVVVGAIGKIFLITKTKAPTLTLSDDIPREIPALLANKLAHEIAARLLERGDRQSDDAMAQRAHAKFMDAKLDTIAAINNFGGNFDTIKAI